MRERREEALLALLRHDIINFSFCRPKEPVKLKDLLPDESGAKSGPARPRKKRMTAKLREEIAASWRRTLTAEMEAARKR